ncbi:MAG: 5-formyltetrahydrofolate cyclo-ligase [Clostridium sp.]|nr:5-formyltetrahydrofolate cyclo-ligase [Clostridium sp.]
MVKEKTLIRNIVMEKRKALSKELKEVFDNNILDKILSSKEYKEAKTILVYVSFEGEVDTHKFIKYAIDDNKKVCVPKVMSKQEGMKAVNIGSFNDLKVGKYGILEPLDFSREVQEKEIDLVIMPGVAFDKNGGRVGYGGAFYDRFLKKLIDKIPKIALAYDFQVFDKVPVEEHDEKIDRIITN